MDEEEFLYARNGDDAAPPSGIIEHEWLLNETFAACPRFDWDLRKVCGDTERVIRYVPTNFGKALYCTQGHHHKFEGKTFIPAEEFGRLGRFCGVLPPELTPGEYELKRKRWKIFQSVKDELAGRTFCAKCLVPELNTWDHPDVATIWEWLSEFDVDLFGQVQEALRDHRGFEMRDWWQLLPVELREKVRIRTNKSTLQYDHGVPRKKGDAIWYSLTRDGRKFLQESLILRICRKCNDEKSSKLPPRRLLIEQYINFYFDGSMPAAMADPRWSTFEEVLVALYGSGEVAV